MGKKWLHWNPYSKHLLIPSAGFLSKVLGTQRLTIHSFSWHITPKPDVPPKSGVVPRSLHQPSFCASFKSCNERKYRLWVETDPGSSPDFVNADSVTQGFLNFCHNFGPMERAVPSTKDWHVIKHSIQCPAGTKNQASYPLSFSLKAILLFQPRFGTIGQDFSIQIKILKTIPLLNGTAA